MNLKMPKFEKKATLKSQMQDLVDDMSMEKVGSPEYMKKVEQLEKIAKVDKLMKGESTNVDTSTLNTVLVILGGLGEILLIMHYEEVSNFTGKAFSRILRPKLP